MEAEITIGKPRRLRRGKIPLVTSR